MLPGTIPSSDRQENKEPADVREPGVRGNKAVDCAQRVEATDREGIHCMLHELSHLFCLFKPGSQPLFAAGLSLSQHRSWHYDMVRLHLKPQPTHHCLIIDVSHDCFSRFGRLMWWIILQVANVEICLSGVRSIRCLSCPEVESLLFFIGHWGFFFIQTLYVSLVDVFALKQLCKSYFLSEYGSFGLKCVYSHSL